MSAPIRGRVLVAGAATGEALTAVEPLSFWGGYDQFTGEIIDRRHPLSGTNAIGKVMVIPASRGSSTTAAVLLEAIRRENAPAAVVTAGTDRFLTLAAVVALELYQRTVAIVSVEPGEFETLLHARRIEIDADGTITSAA